MRRALMLVALLAASCGKSGPLANISVHADGNSPLLINAIGGTLQLTVSGYDADGQAVSAGTVTWTSADTSVATVSGTGLVTAVANGKAHITATSGAVSGLSVVVVAQAANTVSVVPQSSQIERGATVSFT